MLHNLIVFTGEVSGAYAFSQDARVLRIVQSRWKSWKGGIMEWHPASRQESINPTQQCIEKNQLVRWPF
jgi:hypothetical protein